VLQIYFLFVKGRNTVFEGYQQLYHLRETFLPFELGVFVCFLVKSMFILKQFRKRILTYVLSHRLKENKLSYIRLSS